MNFYESNIIYSNSNKNKINMKDNYSQKDLSIQINESLIKEYKFPLEKDIYLIKIEMKKDSVIIKANINDICLNIFYIVEYSFSEILKINDIFKDFKNNEDLFNLILNVFSEPLNILLKIESNFLIINNVKNNIQFKLEKYTPSEDDAFNDIFNKLSLLEEQINDFTNEGKKLTNNLNKYENKIEKLVKNKI